MNEFEFTLIVDLHDDVSDSTLDKIYTAMNDCTFSQRSGATFLQFNRESENLETAILSAMGSVCKLGIKVRRVDVCSLVTQSEIARRASVSRQVIHNYASGKRGAGFPTPICYLQDDDHAALWNWCEVAQWLAGNNLVSERVLEEAFLIDIINTYLESQFHKSNKPGVWERVERSLDECESCQ